jgi:NDP-sugar pyrophosphorylase family protein
VKRAAEFIGEEPFMLTYGDGVSNVSIPKLLDFHRAKAIMRFSRKAMNTLYRHIEKIS